MRFLGALLGLAILCAATSGAVAQGSGGVVAIQPFTGCVKWQSVNIITGTGAPCATGSGNVTTDGTATAGQNAYFTTATNIEGRTGFSVAIDAQTGTSYVIPAADNSALVTLTNASPIAVTLPQAVGSFTTGWNTNVCNLGAGLVTITPTTSTVNGLASFTLRKWDCASVVSDGANYSALFYNGGAFNGASGAIAIGGGAGNPLTFTTSPNIGTATGTSLALGGCTLGSNAFCVTGQTTLGGNLQFNADNTYNIGTGSGSTACGSSPQCPANIYVQNNIIGKNITAGFYVRAENAGALFFNTQGGIWSPSDGVFVLKNNAGTSFGRLQFGGSTSSFASIKLSGTLLQTRLADDSAYAAFEANTLRTATPYTVGTLPAAGSQGRRAYVTDQLTTCAAIGAAPTGGGSVVCPVFDNGSAWISG